MNSSFFFILQQHRRIKTAPHQTVIFTLLVFFFFYCFHVFAADENQTSNPRLLFNHGAELAATGKLIESEEVLRQVAVVRDKTIAAKALTLLGQVAAASAKQNVAENPAETPQEQRQIIIERLQSAEQSFAESLSLVPNDHVRQYLETLRAWQYNMTRLWNDYDRQQRRNVELQRRIQQLADEEKTLIESIRPIMEEPNSPRKSQTAYESGGKQKQLAEELDILKNVPVEDEKLKEQWTHFPEIQKVAQEAADLLSQNRMSEALPKQQQVLDFLQSLLKQEQKQQNQPNTNQQNQQQNSQDQQDQNKQDQNKQEKQEQEEEKQQQNQQSTESKDDKQQAQEMNPQQVSAEELAAKLKEEEAKEKAERLLLQVRRKEQAAEKRREQLRAAQIQATPVEKDW